MTEELNQFKESHKGIEICLTLRMYLLDTLIHTRFCRNRGRSIYTILFYRAYFT